MEVVSFPGLEKELKDALLCSVSDDKVILHSKNKQIRIYDRQNHEIERYSCPSGRRQRNRDCFCSVTSDAIYHVCATHVRNEGGLCGTEMQIYKLDDNSMRNVKTLKYDNTSQRYFCGSTFHTLVNGKWITFSFEVMKEIVINDRPSFAIFTHRDRLYALDNGKLYSLDLSNAGERIELSDGVTTEGDVMKGLFFKSHTVGDDVFIVRNLGDVWRLNMTNRKIEKLPIDLPHFSSYAFCGNELYFRKDGSQEVHKRYLTPYLSTQRETVIQAVQENEPTCPVCREKFENPKMMPKCGHSLCESCEVKISVEDPFRRRRR